MHVWRICLDFRAFVLIHRYYRWLLICCRISSISIFTLVLDMLNHFIADCDTKLITVKFHNPDNWGEYLHMIDFRKLSSLQMYNGILVSWFILTCLSLTWWLKTWLARSITHKCKLNQRFKQKKTKRWREYEVTTIYVSCFCVGRPHDSKSYIVNKM